VIRSESSLLHTKKRDQVGRIAGKKKEKRKEERKKEEREES
jgi:hypothetical protein